MGKKKKSYLYHKDAAVPSRVSIAFSFQHLDTEILAKMALQASQRGVDIKQG